MKTASQPETFLPSFGRRKSKTLRQTKRTLLAEDYPKLEVSIPEGMGSIDPALWFGKDKSQLWMEIGFGGGEFLAHQAKNHPDVGFIGCEPYLNGVASALRLIKTFACKNVRVWKEDARLLLVRFRPGCLDKVFILFPDPWPKKRHHKRRIVSNATLDLLAKSLKPEGELLLATDHPEYAEWMFVHLIQHPSFEWLAKSASDWRNPPPGWTPTRYETKTRAEGRNPVFLHFRKRLKETA